MNRLDDPVSRDRPLERCADRRRDVGNRRAGAERTRLPPECRRRQPGGGRGGQPDSAGGDRRATQEPAASHLPLPHHATPCFRVAGCANKLVQTDSATFGSPCSRRLPADLGRQGTPSTAARGSAGAQTTAPHATASHGHFSGARAGLGFLSSFALGVASAARSPSTHCIPSRWCRKILGSWNTATLLPREQWNTRPLPTS